MLRFLIFALLSIILLSNCIIGANGVEPFIRVENQPMVLLDENRNVIKCFARPCEVRTDQRVIIQSTLQNMQDKPQRFVYAVQIQDIDSFTTLLSWVTGTLESNGKTNVTQSWTPDKVGTYAIETSVWQSVDFPDPLSPTRVMDVKVLPGSDKEKTLLWIDTYPEYAVHSFETNVIKGHLLERGLIGLPNQKITFYLESISTINDTGLFYHQIVGSIVTDDNGCFYFPLLGYNIRELYQNFTDSKNLNSNMSAILTLGLEFDGNTVYHMSNAKSRIYYNPEAFTSSSPPLEAYLVNGTHSINEISISPNSETSLQLWVSNRIMEGIVELDAKNLPCGVDAEFEPETLSFQDAIQKLSTLKLTISDDAELGNYIIHIVTENNPTELQISPAPTENPFQFGSDRFVKKDLETELLALKLRVN